MFLGKRSDETAKQFVYRVCAEKEAQGLTWEALACICNVELGWDHSESWYRKRWNGYLDMAEAKALVGGGGDEYLEELHETKREIEKATTQYRDMRNDYNRALREAARREADMEMLKSAIAQQNRIDLDVPQSPQIESDTDMLVLLTDLHIGQTFDTYWGKYNADIARQRLGQYLAEILSVQTDKQAEVCYVALLGDLISGGLHYTIKITDRENVIQQVILCAEMVLSFVKVLAKHFRKVVIASVDGNHSRLDKKDLALKDERLDQIITWYIKSHVGNAENLEVIQSPFDNTVSLMNIRGKKYVLCHGDYDTYNKIGALKLSAMVGGMPYAILFGHYHTNSFSDDAGGIKLLRGGSLAGCGDDYTVTKRLNGKPGQLFCTVSSKGIKTVHPLEFSD